MLGVVQRGVGFRQRIGVDVDQGDAVTVRQKPLANGQADAARATGDYGDWSCFVGG
jgi:hypothetical protein